MQIRKMGRLGWPVSEVGYGMWGLSGAPGPVASADLESAPHCLSEAVRLGCNFFDTAWAYGHGVGEQMLGRLLRDHPDKRLYVATKIPPKNGQWPPQPDARLEDVFPADHIRRYTEMSLKNLGVDRIDLMQLHVWEDRWAADERWQRTLADLRREGLIDGIGLSLNRWEPTNGLQAIETGLVDVIQVTYNLFDQSPEDELFHVARERNIGIIARVPFDEGGLTGQFTPYTRFPDDDWRNDYFSPENLEPTVQRANALKPLVPTGSTLPELALRFILHHPAVSTVIPGMHKPEHVRANMATSDGRRLPLRLLAQLRQHRWDRQPMACSH